MLNTKPDGPTFRVIMFYDRRVVYEMTGTDNDGVLPADNPPEFAGMVMKQILSDLALRGQANLDCKFEDHYLTGNS